MDHANGVNVLRLTLQHINDVFTLLTKLVNIMGWVPFKMHMPVHGGGSSVSAHTTTVFENEHRCTCIDLMHTQSWI